MAKKGKSALQTNKKPTPKAKTPVKQQMAKPAKRSIQKPAKRSVQKPEKRSVQKLEKGSVAKSAKRSVAKSTPTTVRKETLPQIEKQTPPAIHKSAPREKAKRVFFRVGDDCEILNAMEQRANTTQLARATAAAVRLGRSVESIRDRIKRYLKKLTPEQIAILREAAKKNRHAFAHFTGKQVKTFQLVDDLHPSAKRETRPRKPTERRERIRNKPKLTLINPSRAQKEPLLRNDLSWIATKLSDNDPHFALDHAVSLLADIFDYLIKNKIATREQVDQFVLETRKSVTLENVFKYFHVDNV